MPIGQAMSEGMEPYVQATAKLVASRVTNQPHYFSRVPCGALYVEVLGVSKRDLETDIAHEVANLIRRLMGLVSGT